MSILMGICVANGIPIRLVLRFDSGLAQGKLLIPSFIQNCLQSRHF